MSAPGGVAPDASGGPMADPRRGSAVDLFLGFDGRLERERWLGAVALLVALAVATHVGTWLLVRAGLAGPRGRDLARLGVQVFLVVPWLALDWKRFHDLALPGALAALCPGLMLASRLWDAHAAGPAREPVASGLAWAQFALALVLAYALALRRGTTDANRYGADPRGTAS